MVKAEPDLTVDVGKPITGPQDDNA